MKCSICRAVQSLIEGQKKSDARIDALAEQMQLLTKRVDRLGERMDQLTVRMDRLTERMDQLTVRMDQLAERMAQLTVRMDQLTERVDQLTVSMTQLTQRVDQLVIRMDDMKTYMDRRFASVDRDLGTLKGFMLEQQYRLKSSNAFYRVMRKARVLGGDALDTLLDQAVQQGLITNAESYELDATDIILRGRDVQTDTPLYGVVEISWGIGINDVNRAAKRATILSKLGTPTIPIVAGQWLTPEATQKIDELKVFTVLDNKTFTSESESRS